MSPDRPRRTTVSVTFDADVAQWQFRGPMPGPAGLARLVLGDVRLEVDAVDPATVVEVSVDVPGWDPAAAPTAGSRALVGALLGEPLAGLMVARSGGRSFDAGVYELDPDGDAARVLAGRVALLGELRGLDEGDGARSTWWAVEEACLRADLEAATGLAALGPSADQVADAAAFVATFAERPTEELSDAQRSRLLARLRRLSRLLGPTDPELAARLGRLEGRHLIRTQNVAPTFETLIADLPDFDPRDRAMAGRFQPEDLTLLGGVRGTPADEEARPVRYLVPHDDDLAPGIVAPGRRIEVEWYRERDEMRAFIPLRPGVSAVDVGELWVRVHLRPPDGPPYLLDMSQATADPDDARRMVARLLVSSSFSAGQLLLDVTLDPSEPPLTPASRARHRAVRLALSAARAERRKSRDAGRRWEECHREWIAAGDAGRAALALARAARDPANGDLATRLADEARTLLAKPRAAWAEAYLGELAEVPEPFDGELFDE